MVNKQAMLDGIHSEVFWALSLTVTVSDSKLQEAIKMIYYNIIHVHTMLHLIRTKDY